MPARSAKKRRKSRKQKGGTPLTSEQINSLGRLGFTDDQKKAFSEIVAPLNENVTAMLVNAARDDIRRINPRTGRLFTPQELIDSVRNTVGNAVGGKRRRKSRKKRKGKKVRKTRKQRGGTVFEEPELTELGTLHFNDDQKKELGRRLALNSTVAMNYIRQSLQQINPQTGQVFTPQELIDSLVVIENNNVNDLSDIESDSDDEHSFSDDDELHAILINDDDDEEPMTPPPRTEGGKRRRKSRKQRGGTDFTNVRNELNNLGIVEDDDIRKITQFYTVGPNDAIDTIRNYLRITYPAQGAPYTQAQITAFIQSLNNNGVMGAPQQVAMPVYGPDGGKRKRKSRKMKGGARYGTGVGANNFDPNYSIYNTQELGLFPYKPN